jgi:hypothetical protein
MLFEHPFSVGSAAVDREYKGMKLLFGARIDTPKQREPLDAAGLSSCATCRPPRGRPPRGASCVGVVPRQLDPRGNLAPA